MRLFYNFNHMLRKIEGEPEGFKKVKSKKAIYGAFKRKIMANNIKVFNRETKTGKPWNDDNGTYYRTAAGCHFSGPIGMRGINSNTYRAFRGDHRLGAACVESEPQEDRFALADNPGRADNQPMLICQFECFHALKCGYNAFGQGIFGISNKYRPFSFNGSELVIGFIAMRAMRDKLSRHRRSSRFIDFVYSNQQPLAVETLLDGFNFFCLHNISLDDDDTIENIGSQGEREAGYVKQIDMFPVEN